MNISTISIILTLFSFSLSFGSFERGLNLYEEGEYENAIQAFEVETNSQETGAVRHNLGVSYFQNGDLAGAIWNMERANLLNPENEAYRFKLNALREQVGLPPVTMSWKERATGILHHDQWMRVLIYLGLTSLAGYLFPIAAGWKHNSSVIILIGICTIGFVISGFALAEVRARLKKGTCLAETPTELHAAPAGAAPQTGLIRTGERALILERHKDFLRVSTEGGAEGWIHRDLFRQIR